MLSLNKIKRLVKENRPYLEALEELDRTGKLRKVNYKERVNFTIDETLLNKFKDYCRKNNYKMSAIIENQIKKVLSK